MITYSDEDSEQKTETMSGDYMAKVSLILSNLGQRKDKTLEEQIWEIKELEPYLNKNSLFYGIIKSINIETAMNIKR